MARTYRRIPSHWLRRPKTTNSRRGEYGTVRDMLENDLPVRNRHRTRGNLTSRKIPTSWDDMIVSALSESLKIFNRMSRWEYKDHVTIGQKCKIPMPHDWNGWGCCVFYNERGSGRDI